MKITTPQQAECFKIGDERPGQKRPDVGDFVFTVFGAGTLRVRPSKALNGKANCISIGCSWGAYGFAGGTMETSEVMELSDLLKAWIEEQILDPAVQPMLVTTPRV
jgi:hypothetical protein